MSDNESPADPTAEEVVEQPSPTTPESPTEEPGEVSPDVAPTRKTRRRPEHKPPPADDPSPQETSETKPEAQKASNESAVLQGGWGYWGSWGKSLLSTATATVATVGQGISQVIEKAETTLGIPSPEELSAQPPPEENTDAGGTASAGAEGEAQDDTAMGGALGMLSSLSSVVQSTGKTVITGGLDALEFIGKKTMDVIAEGDPGFKKTKGLMIRPTTLSQVLREAKEREEQQTSEDLSSDVEKKAHYGMLFDEFQGLAHLEALESLSRESEIKVKSVLTTMSGAELAQLKADLEEVSEPFSLMEFEDDEDETKEDGNGVEFAKELTDAVSRLHLSVTADKLSQARTNIHDRIADINSATTVPTQEEDEKDDADEMTVPQHTPEDVHALAIRSLAELTAKSIEHFHKVAQVVLHNASGSAQISTGDQAKVLAQVTVMLCKEISLLSKSFTSCLTTVGSNEKGEVLNPLITGVFLEASNSATYIQDAFQLLRTVLQLAHIQRTADFAQ